MAHTNYAAEVIQTGQLSTLRVWAGVSMDEARVALEVETTQEDAHRIATDPWVTPSSWATEVLREHDYTLKSVWVKDPTSGGTVARCVPSKDIPIATGI